MRTIRDLAWIAGLLEGEGSFHINRSHNGRRSGACLNLAMTDKDVVEKAIAILHPAKQVVTREFRWYKGAKDLHRINMTGSRAVAWMMTLYPFFGARRQAQVRKCLAEWKSRKARPTLAARAWAA